ncbi:UDP-glucose/GDP-mannose dehydrogenase family, NAD binding domain [Thermus arciformis]|uniref:UDP-glucose/GDP-mannose dehydrogenase family, NAD binding domain n=1 Tax=Thermus arciformis TaxID=482827 RepID=A0A1G7H394_9DEIN|nr:hypothetical protein [Thermus arciformis]SDE94892.1 UDP-glucose/GDP-mannose dehydrogenase family, NAD binding domain [Thermus arciformis]
MKVDVIGTSYVGLTTALSLAYVEHEVVGVDLDEGKVAGLKRGEPPFYEPHAKETLALVRDRLSFTTRYQEAIPQAEVVFLSVGTPSLEDGSPNLSQVREAAWAIGWQGARPDAAAEKALKAFILPRGPRPIPWPGGP